MYLIVFMFCWLQNGIDNNNHSSGIDDDGDLNKHQNCLLKHFDIHIRNVPNFTQTINCVGSFEYLEQVFHVINTRALKIT